jgi:hypothetical protein
LLAHAPNLIPSPVGRTPYSAWPSPWHRLVARVSAVLYRTHWCDVQVGPTHRSSSSKIRIKASSRLPRKSTDTDSFASADSATGRASRQQILSIGYINMHIAPSSHRLCTRPQQEIVAQRRQSVRDRVVCPPWRRSGFLGALTIPGYLGDSQEPIVRTCSLYWWKHHLLDANFSSVASFLPLAAVPRG